jgi:hypothetical protein
MMILHRSVCLVATLAAMAGTAAPTPVSADAQPTLGVVWASNQRGYGTVRPSEVFNGGDGHGEIWNITWSSWGGAQVTGTGTAGYADPGEVNADEKPTPVVIVAWDLGPCNGKQVYRAVDWYFPSTGQTLIQDPHINICTGAYPGE